MINNEVTKNEAITNNNLILEFLDITNEEKNAAVSRVKQQVKEPWTKEKMDRYNNESVTRDGTNCYAYAIGATSTISGLYRPGLISKCKPPKSDFQDEYELVKCFKKDCDWLNLPYTHVLSRDPEVFAKMQREFGFYPNEHMVGLFSVKYYDGIIRGFHFIRYDPEFGWSEKKDYGGYATKIENLNSVLGKPELTFAGCFIIHRRSAEDDKSNHWEESLS